MSLRERLGNKIKTDEELIESIDSNVEYYENNEVAKTINSLGVVENLLTDSSLNAIYILGAHDIYVERKGKVNKTTLAYRDDIQLDSIIRRLAQKNNVEIDEENPIVTFKYRPGIIVRAVLSPISNPINVTIKCYKDKFSSLELLQKEQCFSKEIALFLGTLTTMSANCLIVGERNTFKTTLLSAIAKKLPLNNRGVVVDYSKELELDIPNIINYDLSSLSDDKIKKKLIKTLFISNPDKIFLNDCDEFELFAPYLLQGSKNLIATITANNPDMVVKKFKNNFYNMFDVLIYVKTLENGAKKIDTIYAARNENVLDKVFYLNNFNDYKSCGFIPDFCRNNTQLTANMFDIMYKHTYQIDKLKKPKLQANRINRAEILKKFKKDLPQIKTVEVLEEKEKIKPQFLDFREEDNDGEYFHL